MSLEHSIHIPWNQMTPRQQAYWDAMCECDHTRLDHGATLRGMGGPCTRCPRNGLFHRPTCRRFRYSMEFEEWSNRKLAEWKAEIES